MRQRRAVVLGFDGSCDSAPIVRAKARDDAAQEMIRAARRYGVSLHQESMLLDRLERVPTDTEISPELYERVAEVLVATAKKPLK